MSDRTELLYVEIERLTCWAENASTASTPAPRYFVSAVDAEYGIVFGVWDGPLHIDALQAAAEWGLPVFDQTGSGR